MRRTREARIRLGAYIYRRSQFWDDSLLVRSNERAVGFAAALGDAQAIVMRGNGAVCIGEPVEVDVVMAFFLEEAAATELDVMASGACETSV